MPGFAFTAIHYTNLIEMEQQRAYDETEETATEGEE